MGSRLGADAHGPKKSRGRPPTYVWNEHEVLTDSEKRLKVSIEKRRERQKKSYYKKKTEKMRATQSSHPSSHSYGVPDYIFDDYACSSSSTPAKRSLNSPLVVVREYHGP